MSLVINDQHVAGLKKLANKLNVAVENVQTMVSSGEIHELLASSTKEKLSMCGFVEYMSNDEIDARVSAHNAALEALMNSDKCDTAIEKIFSDEIRELESIRGLMLAPEWVFPLLKKGMYVVGTDGEHVPFSPSKMIVKNGKLPFGFIAKEEKCEH